MYWNDCKIVMLANTIRLTLTWDVLKYKINEIVEFNDLGLTLTWDVLKYF